MDHLIWIDLLNNHQREFPVAHPQDLYKFLFQGMRGPAHLTKDVGMFTNNLEDELKDLVPDPDQPLLEPIRPDGKLCRVHLRAWLATGKSMDELVQECLRAARNPWNTQQELIETWKAYGNSGHGDTRSFTTWLEANDYPPVHHSLEYVKEYHPSYRLIMK